MSIGERIRQERDRLGETQDEWARHTGIHRNTQAKYEKGDAVPDVNYLTAIDELGADIDFIRTGERRAWKSSDDYVERQCSIVQKIVECVEAYTGEKKISISPARKASLVAAIYRSAFFSGNVDTVVIEEVVKLTAG